MSEGMKSVMMGSQPAISIGGTAVERNLSGSSEADNEKICQSFESFMLYSMIKHLEKTTKMSKKGLKGRAA